MNHDHHDHADDDEIDGEPSAAMRWVLRIGLGALTLLVIGGLAWWLKGYLSGGETKPPAVQQIALIKQPPPPPPPKPPEKPPEPPKIKEQVKIDEPKEVPKPAEAKSPDDKPAADKPLAVDAAGGAGTDNFGLVGNPGGRAITELGNGIGGVSASRGAYYSGLLQRAFFDALTRNRKVLKDEFRVVVKVWLADDGRVQRADVVSGSGNAQTDELIQLTLMEMAPMKDVPPSSMRPMQLRLSNRS